ncbi:hypothetical protein HHI36_000828, partial [Cryptolaemus montrouzieri]
ISIALQAVNEDINRIYIWSVDHGLTYNALKSCFMLVGTTSARSIAMFNNFVTLHINNVALLESDNAKNLGVIFDGQLSLALMVFKTYKNKKPKYLYDLWIPTSTIHGRQLRN